MDYLTFILTFFSLKEITANLHANISLYGRKTRALFYDEPSWTKTVSLSYVLPQIAFPAGILASPFFFLLNLNNIIN